MSAHNPISNLQSRNAVRRKTVGIKTKADNFHCRSIDLACFEFFQSRGMQTYMFSGAPIKKEVAP